MNILITGANRGLGLALVEHGLKQGDTIFATERISSEVLQNWQEQYPTKLRILQFDLTDEQAIIEEKERLEQSGERIDAIINNAAILKGREQSIETLNLDDCLTSFNINTLGPARIIKHFLPLLRKGSQKTILNLSSDSASLTHAYPGDYPYGFSKVALNMLTEKLVRELEEDQIKVLSIHPGWMHTDMGGDQAPINPVDAASDIYKLINHPPESTTGFQFFDYQGKEMDI